ncbi:hypothetical protein ANN_03346 [Periplaneta americana]|uniref:Uncharacterized protein n=1 Tax=Periplaneta americana TaxID=6978 RepID=A0ABQ8TZY9_PERAM|nr:hypothetical protein ANN_03346 [Periplaneta americana]
MDRACRSYDSKLFRWPPRFLDLTNLDFFSRGYVKDGVYVPDLPQAMLDMRELITGAIASIDRTMLQGAWEEFNYGLVMCRDTIGGGSYSTSVRTIQQGAKKCYKYGRYCEVNVVNKLRKQPNLVPNIKTQAYASNLPTQYGKKNPVTFSEKQSKERGATQPYRHDRRPITAESLKWKWGGHVTRMDHRRWTHRLTLWDPWIGRRRVGRQTTRCADFFKKKAGAHWTSSTRDRQLWRNLEATVLSV